MTIESFAPLRLCETHEVINFKAPHAFRVVGRAAPNTGASYVSV